MPTAARCNVFISYVREDIKAVDEIELMLRACDVPVWRDVGSLWPGENWQHKIKSAIKNSSLVFLAVFSDQSVRKERSYQRAELVLAAEEYRLRDPANSWLIPVRLTDCTLPEYDLGAGRTLDSIQRVPRHTRPSVSSRRRPGARRHRRRSRISARAGPVCLAE